MRKLRRLRQYLSYGSYCGRMKIFSAGKGKARQTSGCAAALPFFFAGFLIIFFFALPPAEAQSPLPVILRLDSRDTMFRQYHSDVEAARRLVFSSRRSLPAVAEFAAGMTIYSYTLRGDEEFFSIAARCNIPYGTLASLNRFFHPNDLAAGKVLLLPSVPGIFVPEAPETDLERLLSATRAEDSGLALSVPREGKTERFRFIPGDDFTPSERIFFLNPGFRFPLRNFQVSSVYGPRINPVTGRPGMHRGVDLAAPLGTEVFAAKSGTVTALGEDEILGKYIILSHESNWVSLYGHLSSIDVSLHRAVQSGILIGRVGSTGQSTGPHLHFELLQNGQNRDPARLLGIFKGNQGR
jgi:murein DD-endopeptidase MepM/ murein hydrolase activator NlpD